VHVRHLAAKWAVFSGSRYQNGLMNEINVQSWLLTVFQGVTAVGVVYGIWINIETRRQAVAAAQVAAAHALAAVMEIKNVSHEMNSMKDELVASKVAEGVAKSEAADAAGEKRGIEMGRAEGQRADDDRRNLLAP
jgi:hypothetical protein